MTYEFVYSDTLWQEEFLFGCPQGDGYGLKIAVDFDDMETAAYLGPSYTIPASDITLDALNEPYIFWDEGDIVAQGPATAPSYTDTIEHSCVSGCGIADIPVRLIGMIVGEVAALTAKSPDYTGNPDYSPDGTVNLSDLADLGFTYFKSLGDPGYHGCFDFFPDSTVDISDLTLFDQHYTHEYPFLGSTIPLNMEKEPAGTMKLAATASADAGHSGTILVTLSLEVTHDITTMALGIDRNQPGLEYRGWEPNPAFPGTPVALTIDHDGGDLVFIAVLAMDPKGDGVVELGTIEVKGERVRTLVDAFQRRDEYLAEWDGTNSDGVDVSSGVYFYRLEAAGFTDTKKMVLLR